METQEKNEHVPTIDQLADRVVDWMDEAARSDTSEISKRYRESARNALIDLIRRIGREESRRYCSDFFDNVGRYLTDR